MIRFDRDRFLEEGYLIVRGVIPPWDLEALRRSYEILVDRQRGIWSEEAARGAAPADVWQSSAQPRLNLTRTPCLGGRETAPAFEFWLHENIQGASSVLLAEDDAPATRRPTCARGTGSSTFFPSSTGGATIPRSGAAPSTEVSHA